MKKSLIIMICVLLCMFAFTAGVSANDALNEADSTVSVVVHSAVNGVTFKDVSGNALNVTEGSAEDYVTYAFEAIPGTYTYSAEGYGTGTLKIAEAGNIYLRAVDYTLAEAGGCDFQMRVVNTEDEELIYKSSLDNKSVKLLIPALGYGTCYRAYFEPTDDAYASFFTKLWVEKGTTCFEGFKSSSYNLSDGNEYKMGKKVKVTFKIRETYELKVQQLVKFYRQPNEYEIEQVKVEDGYAYYEAYVSNDGASTLQYEVTGNNAIKKVGNFKADAGMIEVTELQNAYYRNYGADYENSIITNINASKFVEMNVGESRDIWFSRAWQPLDSGTTNQYAVPQSYYHILSGDSVEIDEYGVATAVKDGVTVVAVTYDAVEYMDILYGSIDPDKIAVFVFSVGGSTAGVNTGIELSDLHTFYIASEVKIDGSADVIKNASYPYTFTPKVAEADGVTVSVANVYGNKNPSKAPTMSEWKTYNKNADGSYTVDLLKGKNIIRVQSGNAEDYYVLNAVESKVTVENKTNPGCIIVNGDQVKVSYTNVITPQPKLGAIYNPGYGHTVYLTGAVAYADGFQDKVSGPHTQYHIRDNSYFEFAVKAEGNATVKNLRITLGSFGSAPTAHYKLGLQSGGGDYSGGNSPESTAEYCFFQDIDINVSSHKHVYDKEVLDHKFVSSEATATEPAKYCKSCYCGAKGTETFDVESVVIETGAEKPTTLIDTPLERIELLGTTGKVTQGSKENFYNVELPADFDKTKPLVVNLTALLSDDFYTNANKLQTSYFWASTTNINPTLDRDNVSLSEMYVDADGKYTGTVEHTLRWNNESSYRLIVLLAGNNPQWAMNTSTIKYEITLKIHQHDFVNEVADAKHLASAATLDQPAEYYYSCECGENGTETFTYGDSLSVTYAPAIAVMDKIDSIGEVTIESKDAIESARAAYDALDEDQKAFVSNLDVLTAAEDTYAALLTPVELPFTDIPDEWYQDAVRYVYENGIMNGMTETTFEPGTTLSRAMFITMLYRMDGETAVSGDLAYTDVKADFWYTDAIIWGTEAGIINGYGDGIFRPDGLVTRQEMAKMMYCYAEYKGMDMTASAGFDGFNDGDRVASWAAPYMSWAVGSELMKGDSNGNLNPAGNATRAEAATVMMRFAETLEK